MLRPVLFCPWKSLSLLNAVLVTVVTVVSLGFRGSKGKKRIHYICFRNAWFRSYPQEVLRICDSCKLNVQETTTTKNAGPRTFQHKPRPACFLYWCLPSFLTLCFCQQSNIWTRRVTLWPWSEVSSFQQYCKAHLSNKILFTHLHA